MPSLPELLILALAVFRLSLMLVLEDGPFRMFDRLRALSNETGLGAGMLSCVWCTSVWVSAASLLLLNYGGSVGAVILVWLALSGAAVLMHRTVGDQP